MALSRRENDEIKAIISRAGDALMAHWAGKERLKVDIKADGTSVSEADMASNEILVEGLRGLFPADEILSEELAAPQAVEEGRRLWIVDPLDGTRSFLNGVDDFSILVAACVGGVVQHGFMLFPARGWLVEAVRDRGASLGGSPISVSTVSSIRTGKLYTRNFDPRAGERSFTGGMDSGLAFLEVARGGLDAVIIRMTHHKEWDLAAPCLAIEEGGGRVTDENGKRIVYGRPSIEFEYLVATNGRVHGEALEVIASEVAR